MPTRTETLSLRATLSSVLMIEEFRVYGFRVSFMGITTLEFYGQAEKQYLGWQKRSGSQWRRLSLTVRLVMDNRIFLTFGTPSDIPRKVHKASKS